MVADVVVAVVVPDDDDDDGGGDNDDDEVSVREWCCAWCDIPVVTDDEDVELADTASVDAGIETAVVAFVVVVVDTAAAVVVDVGNMEMIRRELGDRTDNVLDVPVASMVKKRRTCTKCWCSENADGRNYEKVAFMEKTDI
jgi:hypothetical protein